jgi:hypothetical protein
MLSVKEAQIKRVCRICEKPHPGGGPKDFFLEFGRMTWPESWTFNFGEEFAHTECLEKSTSLTPVPPSVPTSTQPPGYAQSVDEPLDPDADQMV